MNTIHSGILAIVMSVFLIRATDPPQDGNLDTPVQLTQSPYQANHFLKLTLTNAENSQGTNASVKEELKQPQNDKSQGNSTSIEIINYTDGTTINTTEKISFEDVKKESPKNTKGDTISTFIHHETKSEYEKLLERDFVRPLLELYKNSSTSFHFNFSNVDVNTDIQSIPEGSDSVFIVHNLSEEDLDKLHTKYNRELNINNKNGKILSEEVNQAEDAFIEVRNDKKTLNQTEPKSNLTSNLEEIGFNQIYVLTKDDFESLLRNAKMMNLVFEDGLKNSEDVVDTGSLNLEEDNKDLPLTTSSDSIEGRISKEDNMEDIKQLTKEDLDTLASHPTVFQNPFDIQEEKGIYRDGDKLEDNSSSKIEQSGDVTTQTSIRRDDNGLLDNNPQDEHIGEILPSNYKTIQDKYFTTDNQHFQSIGKRNHFMYSNTIQRRGRKSYDYEDLYRYPDSRFRSIRFRPDYVATSSGTDVFEPISFPDEQSYKYRDQRDYPVADENRMYTRPARYNYIPSEAAMRFPHRQRYRDLYESNEKEAQVPWRGLVYSRRPRVIFPSDLVAFREQNQDDQDYLAGDSNLQDLQQQDTRDRGEYVTLDIKFIVISFSPPFHCHYATGKNINERTSNI